MKHYRVRLTVTRPLGTPILSGTLWGHLAWAIRYLDGEMAVQEWLVAQQANPWLLSSATPAGFLPRPLLRSAGRSFANADLAVLEARKRRRRLAWIPEDLFTALRDRLAEPALDAGLADGQSVAAGGPPRLRVAHNTIDRRTAMTPDHGGLYFKDDKFPTESSRHLTVFIRAPEADRERIERLLAFVGENGYGRDASTGRGTFDVSMGEETALFGVRGTRAISLSHGVITDAMADPRYKLHVHFGKLGGTRVNDEAGPFKYPVLMARPGATFVAAGDEPLGAMLGGPEHPLHRRLTDVFHHAFHLPLWFTEANP